MLSKVEGLNSLIQDLFELSVLEARRVDLALEKLPLLSWKDRIMEQYGLEMESRGIAFDCSLATESTFAAAVTVDIRRMDRVIANLLYNAIKYTPSGGSIRITMSGNASTIEVLVADSGSGIEPDDLPYLFDRYFKNEKSRSSASSGSGLGLAISKEIVEMHGGQISALNPPEGGGVFRIVLPLAK
jgi:signal transduction histidine kinase